MTTIHTTWNASHTACSCELVEVPEQKKLVVFPDERLVKRIIKGKEITLLEKIHYGDDAIVDHAFVPDMTAENVEEEHGLREEGFQAIEDMRWDEINKSHIMNTFKGKYAFLNPTYVMPEGITIQEEVEDTVYPSIANAFAAMACKYKDDAMEFVNMNPYDVAINSKKYPIRDGWDEITQAKALLYIVNNAYRRNPEEMVKLLNTDDMVLVYKNQNGDDKWGKAIKRNLHKIETEHGKAILVTNDYQGDNFLGRALCKVRDTFAAEHPELFWKGAWHDSPENVYFSEIPWMF